MRSAKKKPIQIDLDGFKLHLNLTGSCELSLHFDTPSRRFYLSVIALVANEMKKRGRTTTIALGEHWKVLTLLNETVGAGAGSSSRESLLPRIYRKWKDALPDLENAPLFKVLGRRKDYGDGGGKAYQFTDEEKDAWANLFEYKGSFENVRLRFSIDRLGTTIDDVEISYGESAALSSDDGAWGRFVNDLQKVKEKEPGHVIVPVDPIEVDTSEPRRPSGEGKGWAQWRLVTTGMIIIAILVGLTLWVHLGADTETASKEKMAFPLPNKPSVAVLPFANMTGDASQEYMVDGLTETIITALARVPQVFVIARNSTFIYKGKAVRVQQVAEELGIQYILEGSVQRSGDKVRITAQFVDALNGRHLWATQYDREMKDLFQVTDEITRKVMEGVWVLLGARGKDQWISRKAPKNTEAYLKYFEVVAALRRLNPKENARAKRLAEEIIAMDPEYSGGYNLLGRAYYMDVLLGTSKSPSESLAKALELTQRAVATDEFNPTNHDALGYVYSLMREHERALVEFEKALELCPSCPDTYMYIGFTQYCMEETEKAIASMQSALRLNPYPPINYYAHLGNAYRHAGRYEDAVSSYKKALQISPNVQGALVGLVNSYSLMGREEEARSAAQELLRVNPRFSVENYTKSLAYKDHDKVFRFADALRKAGLK